MEDLIAHMPKILAAYSILLVAAISPGPAVAFLLGVSASRGRAAALTATTGIAFGSTTINLMTMLGVGLLLSQAAWAMEVLRIAGACYLLWLAYGAFRRAAHPPALAPAGLPGGSGRLFAAGWLMQTTNPKAIAFWLAIAAIGATAGAGPLTYAAFFTGAFALSFICHAAWALLLSAAPVRAAYAAGRRWIEGALGTFFCFAAWKIAASES
ncbi:LysE family translocator [Pseudooceanicola algae]|uniref:Threonine efflux protein n=1 Tax=Pseudooceanicola algae TaxID=1537215 RepID=A0A418SKR0_9RHOB|nr:LysE family translocator [Pseudooceanicola algae]QPM91002.1 Threonine efflux protein [Pseudooceanicola algae]